MPRNEVSFSNVTRKTGLISRSVELKTLLVQQHRLTGRKAYPVLQSDPERAHADALGFLEHNPEPTDVVLFDLPGTLNTKGVFRTLSMLDYVLCRSWPTAWSSKARSCIRKTLQEQLIGKRGCNLKGIYHFWTSVDRRVRTDLYERYEGVLEKLGLSILRTRIPVRSKFSKKYRRTEGRSTVPRFWRPTVRSFGIVGSMRWPKRYVKSPTLPSHATKGNPAGRDRRGSVTRSRGTGLSRTARSGRRPAACTGGGPGQPAPKALRTEPFLSRRRRIVPPDYADTFLCPTTLRRRVTININEQTRDMLITILQHIGPYHLSLGGYVERILRHHIETFRDEINALNRNKRDRKLL